jgi:hypothetical protein
MKLTHAIGPRIGCMIPRFLQHDDAPRDSMHDARIPTHAASIRCTNASPGRPSTSLWHQLRYRYCPASRIGVSGMPFHRHAIRCDDNQQHRSSRFHPEVPKW